MSALGPLCMYMTVILLGTFVALLKVGAGGSVILLFDFRTLFLLLDFFVPSQYENFCFALLYLVLFHLAVLLGVLLFSEEGIEDEWFLWKGEVGGSGEE